MPVRENLDALIENAIACILEGAPAIRDLGKPDNKAGRPPGSFAAFVTNPSGCRLRPPTDLGYCSSTIQKDSAQNHSYRHNSVSAVQFTDLVVRPAKSDNRTTRGKVHRRVAALEDTSSGNKVKKEGQT
jgi:hypothetical protein